jgi:hypothetical protein
MGQRTRTPRSAAATVAAMTYLVVGLDRQTLVPWHENIRADDAEAAARVALGRAEERGIDLVVAAVIGPGANVVSVPVDEHTTPARAA